MARVPMLEILDNPWQLLLGIAIGAAAMWLKFRPLIREHEALHSMTDEQWEAMIRNAHAKARMPFADTQPKRWR